MKQLSGKQKLTLARDFKLADLVIGRIAKFSALVLRETKTINLISAKSGQAIFKQHIYDSLTAVPWIRKTNPPTIIDLGSGGGFPLMILAITFPAIQFTAVESVGKKAAFLNQAKLELGLKNVTVLHDRIENVAKTELRATFPLLIARALAPLGVLVEYAVPFLSRVGEAVFYKTDPDEIKREQKALVKLGLGVPEIVDVSHHDLTRYLFVLKKNKETPDS